MHRTAAAVLSALLALPSLAAVTGVVMTPDGAPVAGAKVSLHALETPEARRARLLSDAPQPVALVSTQTDARGNWTLESPKEPVVDLRITAAGFDPAARRIERDEEVGALVLWKSEMKPGSVRGGGKPVAGATVVLSYGGADYITKTDEQGKYEAPEPKRLRGITVIHPSWAIDEEAFFTAAPANVLSRTLVAGTSIAGRVLGADGTTPAAKAAIVVDGWPLATTADDGTFTVAHAPSRWTTVVAQSGALMGTRAQSSEKSLTIRLARAGTITGRVTDGKTKVPVAGAIVRAGSRMARLMTTEGSAAITDAKGNYSIAIAPGSYSVFTSHPAYAANPLDVSVAPGQQASRDFSVTPLARVSGVVMSEDKRPVAAANVAGEETSEGFERMAMRMMSMANTGPVVSGPDGRFSIRVQGDQELRMKAARKGLPTAKTEPFRVAAGERKGGVVITIPNGIAVAGKVTDSAGKPLSGVAVTAGESQVGRTMIRTQIVLGGPASDEDPVRSSSDGTFTIRVKEGTYDFTFRRDGYAQKVVRGQSVTPAQPLSIETTLDPAVEITGRVVRGGTGVDGVNISTFSELGAGATATTGPDGSFTLSGLTPGEVRANIRKETDFISDMRLLTAPGRDVVIEVPAGSRVSGRVIDKESRKPITSFQAGMSTSRSGGGMVISMPPQLKAFTSDDGTFTLDNIPTGAVNLIAQAPGYAQARMNVTIEEGKPLANIELELDPGTKLAGKVTGPDGAAVSGASVRVATGGMGFVIPGAGKQTVTDSDGEYTLEALEVSDTNIEFSHPKYLGTRKEISVKGRDVRLDVQLSAGTRVSGVVVTEAGAPVADAEVDAVAGAGGFRNTKTDANGAFSFDSLSAGRYRFTAAKHGFSEARLDDFDVTSGAPVRLVLRSGATLYGTVRGLSADELQSATVEARGSDGAFANASVDANGSFRLEGAPTGTVRVSAVVSRNFSTRKTSQPKTVNVAAGESANVELEFRSDTIVRGRVTRNNRPLGSANVSFFPKRGASTQTSSSATTDEQGNYSVSGLESGEYTVMVLDMQRFSPYQTTYEVRGSDTFDIDYTAGVVRGRVVDSSTNDPVVDARVTLRATTSEVFRGERSAATDVNGTFSIDSVAPGSYTVSADKTGFGNYVTDLTVTESAPPDVELRLSKNPGVVLKVVDGRDGRPLQANVNVFDQQGRFIQDTGFRFGGAVDTPGDVKLSLGPGSYTATVSAIGYAAQSISLVSPSNQTVALTPGGRIVLRSSRSERQRVRLVDARGHNYPRGPNRPPASDLAPSPSTLPLSNIAPGSYTLQVLTNNDQTVVRSIPIVVVEGRTTEVDV
jgi:large repetitive protein